MSLDKRLKELVGNLTWRAEQYSIASADVDHTVEDIKQAFIDEGWGQIYTMDDEAASNLMTGPEWLARFDEEMRGELFPYNKDGKDVRDTIVTIRKAARRAAGVDDGS